MKSITQFVLFLVCLGLVGIHSAAAVVAQESNGADESKKPSAATEPAEEPTPAKESDDAEDASEADEASETETDAADEADEKKPTAAAKSEQDDKKDAATKKKPKRKTHTVEADRFRVEVELKGTFVARESTEIALRPDAWASFKIEEVIEHGSEVHEGDLLIRFDDQKLTEAIAELELDMHLSDLAIRRAEQELPRVERTLEMALDEAVRANEQVEQDYARFKEIEQEFYEKMVDYTVKGSEDNLDNALDELKQLEKMYEADDLTEETEEIVLKRQRNAVDMAKFQVEDAELYRDGILKITLPRMENRMQTAVERAKLALERAKMANTLDMNRARYELEKRKTLQDKSRERHAKLLVDQALMEVKAPADGVVYFGRCVSGRWAEMSSLISKLQPFGTASPNSVLMTIVKPRPLFVTATVDEEDRPSVEKGQPAKVVPPPKNSDKLAAKVSSVSIAPVSSTNFQVDFELDDAAPADWIVAGMSCDIKVTTYDKVEALAIPEDAVHTDDENTDDEDEDERYVWVVDPDNSDAKPKRRTVTIGKQSDDRLEIVDGLATGDVISLEDEDEETDDE